MNWPRWISAGRHRVPQRVSLSAQRAHRASEILYEERACDVIIGFERDGILHCWISSAERDCPTILGYAAAERSSGLPASGRKRRRHRWRCAALDGENSVPQSPKKQDRPLSPGVDLLPYTTRAPILARHLHSQG